MHTNIPLTWITGYALLGELSCRILCFRRKFYKEVYLL